MDGAVAPFDDSGVGIFADMAVFEGEKGLPVRPVIVADGYDERCARCVMLAGLRGVGGIDEYVSAVAQRHGIGSRVVVGQRGQCDGCPRAPSVAAAARCQPSVLCAAEHRQSAVFQSQDGGLDASDGRQRALFECLLCLLRCHRTNHRGAACQPFAVGEVSASVQLIPFEMYFPPVFLRARWAEQAAVQHDGLVLYRSEKPFRQWLLCRPSASVVLRAHQPARPVLHEAPNLVEQHHFAVGHLTEHGVVTCFSPVVGGVNPCHACQFPF